MNFNLNIFYFIKNKNIKNCKEIKNDNKDYILTLFSGQGFPNQQGLYSSSREHESCGVGFIANCHGIKSNEIIKDGLKILCKLQHRGASGVDSRTGDGAGILIQIPDTFFRQKLACTLPTLGLYGVGNIFLPKDKFLRDKIKRIIESVIEKSGFNFLSWRDLPTNNEFLGAGSLSSEPFVSQIFISFKKKK